MANGKYGNALYPIECIALQRQVEELGNVVVSLDAENATLHREKYHLSVANAQLGVRVSEILREKKGALRDLSDEHLRDVNILQTRIMLLAAENKRLGEHRGIMEKVKMLRTEGRDLPKASMGAPSTHLRLPNEEGKTASAPTPVIRHSEAALSGWRCPRAEVQSRVGDPHDNFLDTPVEEFHAKRAASAGKENYRIHNHAGRASGKQSATSGLAQEGKELKFCTSASASMLQLRSLDLNTSKRNVLKQLNGGLSGTGPVRRKRDREDLLTTDCTQCWKFYDAVGADHAEGTMPSSCDHLKVASRHRFRRLPPDTPEGFWNIGFDD